MVAKILRRAMSCATLFEEQNLEKMLLRATKAFRCMEHSSMVTIFSLCVDSAFKKALVCRHKTYFHAFFLNSEVRSYIPFSTYLGKFIWHLIFSFIY